MTTNDKIRQVFIKPDDSLKRDQTRVINVLRGQSKCDSIDAKDKLVAAIVDAYPWEEAEIVHAALTEYIAEAAPITINVPSTTIPILNRDQFYRSTFETNTKPNYIQQRAKWESDCFLKLYDGVTNFERPKYGALNYLNNPAGVPSAYSYGDLFMTLRPHIRRRVTIATGDTAGSRCLGVLDFCDHVLVSLDKTELANICKIAMNEIPFADYTANIYKEVQIHGELKLNRDIASIHMPAGIHDDAIVNFANQNNIAIVEIDKPKK